MPGILTRLQIPLEARRSNETRNPENRQPEPDTKMAQQGMRGVSEEPHRKSAGHPTFWVAAETSSFGDVQSCESRSWEP